MNSKPNMNNPEKQRNKMVYVTGPFAIGWERDGVLRMPVRCLFIQEFAKMYEAKMYEAQKKMLFNIGRRKRNGFIEA